MYKVYHKIQGGDKLVILVLFLILIISGCSSTTGDSTDEGDTNPPTGTTDPPLDSTTFTLDEFDFNDIPTENVW